MVDLWLVGAPVYVLIQEGVKGPQDQRLDRHVDNTRDKPYCLAGAGDLV